MDFKKLFQIHSNTTHPKRFTYALSRGPLQDAAGCAVATTEDARVYLPLAELVDVEKELQRIAKELKKAEGQAAGLKAKLANEAFLAKAPEQVVAAEKEKARKLDALVENLRESEAKLRLLR